MSLCNMNPMMQHNMPKREHGEEKITIEEERRKETRRRLYFEGKLPDQQNEKLPNSELITMKRKK